jgi:SET domain-containing protein
MLVIPTYVERSNIEGLGLFTAQDIEEGDIIWFLDPSIDSVFSQEEWNSLLDCLPSHLKENFDKWTYTRANGTVVFVQDNAKFFNHSDTPNSKCNGKYDVALRKILKGEELTNDYREFEAKPNEVEKELYNYEEGKETGNEVGTTQS